METMTILSQKPDNLLLISGNDIPFPQAQISIHQPKVKDIALLGEDNFFTAYRLLDFSKNILLEQDKVNLDDKTNFDILIAILREKNAEMQKNRNCVEMLLALIFPECTIQIDKREIILKDNNGIHIIDNSNFEDFKIIIKSIFDFSNEFSDSAAELNPVGEMAKRIAEKLKKRQQKLSESKGGNEKTDLLSRYISILSVGEQKDMNQLLNLTIYQLTDEFNRFMLKVKYDMYIKAQLAGAKDLKDVDDWMAKNIHS